MDQKELTKRILENGASIRDLELKLRALIDVLAREGLVVPDDVEERENAILSEQGDPATQEP